MHSRSITQRTVRAAGACWRWNSVSAARGPLKVCIVGGGPAGFYTAHQLVKKCNSVQIDILEKFPVPFGLMRFGVAPDHVEVKNCIKHFTTLAKSKQCRFIGNVCLGRDMTLAQLKPYYHGLVMAYGAEESRTLGVPGEDLPGVYSARAFVGWYNGLPEHRDLNPDLSGEEAVVIGQGNVAVDVARMLLTPVDILKKTDICQHALEALAESRVRRVQLVGRRGPLQVSFTIKELREMIRLPGCRTVLDPRDFAPVRELLSEVSRPRKRITELMVKTADATGDRDTENLKEWSLLFLRSPVEILPSQTTGRVGGVRLEINKLEALDEKVASYKAVGTGEYEDIKCDMLVRSISFKSYPVDKDLPYDPIKGIIPNVTGRVVDENKNQIRGLYCSGWAKTTPIGVLLTTMAFETADAIVKDFKEGKLLVPSESGDVLNLLKNLPGVDPVTFCEWEAIDKEEKRVGEERGKPREKVVEFERMMQIAKKLSPDLSGEEAVVIGQGNVAVDVARMLLTPVDILKKTDICQHALEALAESRVRQVQLVGHRGPLQVSFTIRELREMIRLPGCRTVLDPRDFDPVRELFSEVSQPRKRTTELMMKTADATGDKDTENLKEWSLLFLRSPVEILPSQTTGRVGGVRLEINKLEALDEKVASYKAVGTGEYEDIKCDMLVQSISFKSFPVDKDLPYDPTKGIIPNVTGRVVDGNKNQIRGLYCSGWAKTTPIGILLTTMAFETADAIVKDFKEGKLLAPSENGDVLNLLKNLPGVKPVTFSEWEAIDEEEKRVGEERGKPREKVVEFERMMQIAKKANQSAVQ